MTFQLLLPLPDVATQAVQVVGFVPGRGGAAPIRWPLLAE